MNNSITIKIVAGTLLFILQFLNTGNAQPKTYPTVDIPGTQSLKINSSIVHQEYELQISLPAGYTNSSKKYPVVYLMDSQWDFPLLKSLYGQQYYDGFIPEMIIVGVTWGGLNPNPDSLRARDYTPTNEKRLPQSGGAEKFLSFMKDELFPFIESTYKANNKNRTLIGCSLGGLFTLYTLFTHTEMFSGYVAASPAFGWDGEVIYKYEQNYFDKKITAPARLCMIMGGVERGVPGFEKLVKHLNDRHYPSLQIENRVLENTGHSGTKGEGFARGLQYVFKKPLINPTTAILNKYTGSYQSANGNSIGIKVEDNRLSLYFGANNKYPLYAATETDFYATSEFLRIHFKKNNNEEGFEMERYGGTEFVKRIK